MAHRPSLRAKVSALFLSRLVILCIAVGSGGYFSSSFAAAPADLSVETIVHGLEAPWAIAFTPDGRIFLTERPGRIRIVEKGQLRTT
ncbi:MAG TPA: PQQ-dependent sugar dehydrogenase, partial [Candidatus Binatus sp.]|nr:PQQ-dependent sugar dehydrogenase [Candidatus Binatus sp.]